MPNMPDGDLLDCIVVAVAVLSAGSQAVPGQTEDSEAASVDQRALRGWTAADHCSVTKETPGSIV